MSDFRRFLQDIGIDYDKDLVRYLFIMYGDAQIR
eukprot:CAMPEP_0115025266 /NCGR_PEP_ID=MMETSP0216-20121206/33868_1 /TAXON_ID=223996 /ORGANISM="Protocruzia adherens, Strain Boccale" /LENGTH=33 /DNA_ID= /DNA_START= /DNA_END= /DNA_ORIENTATION=